MLRPIEESEQRIAAMRTTIAEAERSLHDLSYLFMGDQHRLSDLFLSRRKAFLAEALPQARAEFEKELQNILRRYGRASVVGSCTLRKPSLRATSCLGFRRSKLVPRKNIARLRLGLSISEMIS